MLDVILGMISCRSSNSPLARRYTTMTLSHISQPGQAASDPLLLYLHGAGEVGGDTAQQLRKSGPWANALYDPRNAYRSDTAAALSRFHVLAFHLQEGDWDGAALEAELVAYLAAHPAIDRGRLFLTGVSRGGRGVLRLAIQRLRAGRPVTAVAAFCPAGGAEEYSDADLVLLRQVPICFIHCPEDESVPFEGTAILHRRIGSASSRLRIVHPSELADFSGPHNCWTQFYGHPELYRWLEGSAPDPADWPHLPARR
jgi:predicted peptidase